MKHLFFTLILLASCTLGLQAQNYTKQAQKYFGFRLTTSDMMDLIAVSLPSLEDCEMVFKGDNALEYYGMIEEIKTELTPKKKKTFELIEIDVFSTQDIWEGKNNYAGGMRQIYKRLQPYVVFYQVTQLQKPGDKNGVSYKYWVNINGRWVFFPKPFLAFK